MNRRDAFKMAAAAAAGSVAGKVATERDLVDAMRQALARIPKPGPEVEAHLAAHRKRFDDAMRLQQAIELGDRTAEELPQAEFSLGISSLNKLWCASFISFHNVAGMALKDDRFDIRGRDTDPLTAVQKAREAALEWDRTHFVEMRWDGSVRRPSGEWDEPGPKPGLPDTTWKRLTIRGSGETP